MMKAGQIYCFQGFEDVRNRIIEPKINGIKIDPNLLQYVGLEIENAGNILLLSLKKPEPYREKLTLRLWFVRIGQAKIRTSIIIFNSIQSFNTFWKYDLPSFG